MAYKAFISYSHRLDGNLASSLQSCLHRFAKPWYRLRSMRVFRDKTSLAANPGLWPSLEEALGESEWLLILASPQSAGSHWVQQEIGWWLKNRSSSRLLIVLTDGELAWDEEARDFDWPKTTALPETLRGQIRDEPLYVDLRWARQAETLSLRDARLRGAVLDIVSPLLGRPKDELDGEDVRQMRRNKSAAWTAFALITALGLVAAWQAYVATQQKNTAVSRQLAAQLMNNLGDHLDRALLLGAEAATVSPTVEARGGLLTAFYKSPYLRTFLHGHPSLATAVAFSHDGKILASAGCGRMGSVSCEEGQVLLWDTARQRAAGPPLRANQDPGARPDMDGPWRVAFSPDGKLLASSSCRPGAGQECRGQIALWNLADRTPIGTPLATHAGGTRDLTF